jgi:hypothetical protein
MAKEHLAVGMELEKDRLNRAEKEIRRARVALKQKKPSFIAYIENARRNLTEIIELSEGF